MAFKDARPRSVGGERLLGQAHDASVWRDLECGAVYRLGDTRGITHLL